MKGRRERRIEAYLDGALAERDRRQVECDLARRPAHERHLEDTRRLGAVVREAWNEGPPAPSLDRILPLVRREIARIDARQEAVPLWRRAQAAWSEAFSFVPAGAVAAAAVLVAIYAWPTADVPRELLHAGAPAASTDVVVRGTVVAPTARSTSHTAPSTFTNAQSVHFEEARAGEPAPSVVYDVAQGDTPLFLFRAEDGSMVIWLLEADDLSHASFAKARA